MLACFVCLVFVGCCFCYLFAYVGCFVDYCFGCFVGWICFGFGLQVCFGLYWRLRGCGFSFRIVIVMFALRLGFDGLVVGGFMVMLVVLGYVVWFSVGLWVWVAGILVCGVWFPVVFLFSRSNCDG